MRKSVIPILISFLCLTKLVHAQESKYWKWSDPTPAHHSAVIVMAEESTGARKYASGIYIEYGKLKGILTVRHLMRDVRILKVITQDGKESNYCTTCWKDRDGHDIAFVPYENKELTPLKIAETGPIPGTQYEMIPLIGNEKDQSSEVRAFSMACVKSLNTTGQKSHNLDYYDGYTITGDSGAGIINKKNELVGIQLGGYDLTGITFGVKQLYKGCISTKHSFIVAFLNRLQTHETQLG